MCSDNPANRIPELEKEIERLRRVNSALMDRVEKSAEVQGESFALFQAAIQLETKVHDRTSALETALTELGTSNEELREAKEKADAANHAKSAFLANMSHEIRTPMNGILGMLELLTRTNLEERQSKLARTARGSAKSLLSIIDDILDFSKIEAGKLVVEEVEFSFPDVVRSTVDLLGQRAATKGLDLKYSIVEPFPSSLVGDPVRVRQVLTNLVSNAIKFTAKGEIQITANGHRHENGWRIRAEVSDTGIGLTDTERERVFNSFAQADSSTTRKYGGTGLGLAIARQFVEAMGGEIGVEGKPGEGSTFWFTLPSRVGNPALDQSTQPICSNVKDTASQVSARILLAEDNDINREVAQEMLDALDCSVVTAETGRVAVDRWLEQEFDIVLLDCQMPVMDGFGATKEIRRLEVESGRARTPIIAVTANAMREDRQRCLAAGMDDFLSKPYSMDDLLALIKLWMGRRISGEIDRRAVLDKLPAQSSPPAAGADRSESLAGFDISRLEALEQNGRPGSLGRIVTKFLEGVPTRLREMDEAMERSDLSEIERLAHMLKSSAGFVGALGMAQVAADLERTVTETGVDITQVPTKIATLRLQFEEAAPLLAAFAQRRSA